MASGNAKKKPQQCGIFVCTTACAQVAKDLNLFDVFADQ